MTSASVVPAPPTRKSVDITFMEPYQSNELLAATVWATHSSVPAALAPVAPR